MPLEHFSSGVVLSISDDEVINPRFDTIYQLKWERMEQATKSYKRKPARAIVKRNVEGDGYDVLLYAPKRTVIEGVVVPMTQAATYAEILRQHGEILA